MPGPGAKGTRYRFGPFELSTSEESLSRSGTRVKVQGLPYRLLLMLVERPGEIVTREEVRQRLWPENTFVEFDNSLGVAIRKVRDSLNDDAETPRYVETVPRRGYRFLAPVTIVGADTASALQQGQPNAHSDAGSAVENPTAAARHTADLRPRYWTIAAMVAVLVAVAVYGFRRPPQHTSMRAEAAGFAAPVRTRRSVAVLGFRNLPGRPEDNWLSPAFAEMLNTELAAGGGLRMVSGEDVARAKRELPMTDEDSLAKATLDRFRINAGADLVVLGSYTLLPNNGRNRIRLDVRLQDTARGETIAEEAITGEENDLFELASEAGARLRQRLGVGSIPPEISSEVRAAVPSNQEAVRLYAEGQTKLWALDYIHARDFLVKAVAADPKFPLAHSALADSWSHLGYSLKARAEAEQALTLSQHLPEEQRLLIEGQYRFVLSEWPKAVEVYRKLFDAFPDTLDYGLRLSVAQRWVNPADSLRTLASLQKLPGPIGDDPRIDFYEASAWINQDFQQARAAAKRAIAKGNAQGASLLVGRAYGVLCELSSNAASVTEAISDCENAKQFYSAAGDQDNEARTLSDFAILFYQRGDFDRADAMWRKATTVFRQVGDAGGVAAASNNRGDLLLEEGQLDEAKKLFQESVPNYQAVGDKTGLALVLNDLGDLSRRRGDLDTAEATYRKAKKVADDIGDKSAIAYVLGGLGDVFADHGDMVAARNSYEESLALRNQAGQKQTAGETLVALAKLSIEDRLSTDSAAPLRECKAQFHEAQLPDDELAASTVLAQVLLMQGKYKDAQQEIRTSQPLAAKSQNRFARLQFELTSARVKAPTDDPETSRAQLDDVLAQAHKHEFLGIELEARLELAQLAKRTGHIAESQEQLTLLEKSARAKGFGLIARKAASARA
jgi:eukaryotic-like serine/threonine-protein kinase